MGRQVGEILRTRSHGCFAPILESRWGTRWRQVDDPEGIDLTKADETTVLESLELLEDFPRLPAEDWQRWLALAFDLCQCKAGEREEVSIVLARDEATGRRWRVFVPKQEVGATSVRADLTDLVDLETGERFTLGLPAGWQFAGSPHSHNTMGAFFSGTDDAFELGVPGLYVVVGNLQNDAHHRSYAPKASVVLNRRRYEVRFEDVVDASPSCGFRAFHPLARAQVTRYVPKVILGSKIDFCDLGSGEFSEAFAGRTKRIHEQSDEEFLRFLREEDAENADDARLSPSGRKVLKDVRHLFRNAARWSADTRMRAWDVVTDLLLKGSSRGDSR